MKNRSFYPNPAQQGLILGILVLLRSAIGSLAAEPAKPNEEAGPQIARDAQGNVVIIISDEAQGDMGIKVEKPAITNLTPELRAYARVVDPGPLASALNDIAAADAASKLSSNELARLQLLQGQGNASPRAVQTADAAALKDQLAAQAVRDKFELSWGKAFEKQRDEPAFLKGLVARDAVLIRADLPAGETPTNEPVNARLVTLSGKMVEAPFFGAAPNLDPQLQSRGYLFLNQANPGGLLPNQALVAYLRFPGDPIAGLFLPDQAVVRTEGAGWVYVLKPDGGGFTRVQVSLDRPLAHGWFISGNITSENYVVTTGAQQLLSVEQKGKE